MFNFTLGGLLGVTVGSSGARYTFVIDPAVNADFMVEGYYRAVVSGGTVDGVPISGETVYEWLVRDTDSAIAESFWSVLGSTVSAMNPLSMGRIILRALGVIGSSFKAFSAETTLGKVSVTQGDDMTSATGAQYRFSFIGKTSIEDLEVKGQIVKVGSGIVAGMDDLPAEVEFFSADPTAEQSILVDIPEDVSVVLESSDTATNYELLCRVEFAAGKWVEVGRTQLEVLRGV
jgi:hypothetical protein